MRTQLTLAAVAFGALTTWSMRSALAEPAWCRGASFDDRVDLKDLSAKDPRTSVVTFAHATCKPSAEATANKADIEKNRAAWGKRLGMTDADWADVIPFVAAGEGRHSKFEYSTKDVTAYTPIDQYIAIVDGAPGLNGNTYDDPIYLADMFGTNLSEVARFAYIEWCMGAAGAVTSSHPPAATWALCQADIESFDLAKFHAQLRSDKGHTGDLKMVLRFRALGFKKRLEAHKAAVEAAWKVDPVYKKMFEVAAAARTEWDGGLAKETKLLALVTRMNSAFWSSSRKAYEGCEAEVKAALETAVAKIPASTWQGMDDVRFDPHGGFASTAGPVLMANPEVNLAAEAYVLCRPKSGTASFLSGFAHNTVAFRGPRTTGFARMLSEKLTLDDMNERIDWPKTGRPYASSGGSVSSAGGVVATTKIEGERVIVTLERLIRKNEECVESHRGKKVIRIDPDGTIVYELICDKWGIVEHDETWDDFEINKAYAPLLKKGVKFSSVGGGEGGSEIIALWPDKKTQVPSWLLGTRIK